MSTAARTLREQPHRERYERSVSDRMETGIRPSTLRALLHWYEQAMSDEMPDALHGPGVWRDHGTHAEGGSHLGSPRFTDQFRRYIDGHPNATDADGHFHHPLRSALRHVAESKPARPLTARWLFRVAQCGFDWRRAADSWKACRHQRFEHDVMASAGIELCPVGLSQDQAQAWTAWGLDLLWTSYIEMPVHRPRMVEAAA